MKKFLFACLLCCAFSVAKAQQITFQGKLYQNNQPVTGTGNFKFFINSGGVNWFEEHSSAPVNNGLYAVVLGSITALPLDLFKQSQSIPMEVRYNDVLVSTVSLYAPFERDYTVPDNIKDGISWNEVSNKPTLDTDPANELQTLTLQGNTLSLSPGNSSVILPAGGGNNNTVIGSFTVFDTTATVMPGVGQTGNCSQDAFSTTIWQSFLATSAGKLRHIRVQLGSISSTSLVVNVYEGIGPMGLIGGPAVIPVSGGLTFRKLDFSNLNISLESGKNYTFSISPSPSGTSAVVGRNFLTADPYPNGVSNFGPTADFCFEVFTDRTNPSAFSISSNGYVGISNSSPTSQLSVAGRIEDVTGFVTPVGSIMAFAGVNVPKGWLLCDGSSLSRNQYQELFNAIATSWGDGANPGLSFALPDLRGQFLRGLDGSGGADPDNGVSTNNGTDGKRYAKNPGGNAGNNVGSYQNNNLQAHSHTYGIGAFLGNLDGGSSRCAPACGYDPRATSSTGGSETRPKNAYVNYIIKY